MDDATPVHTLSRRFCCEFGAAHWILDSGFPQPMRYMEPFKARVLVWPGMCGDNDFHERTE
jgi:hypothetical protein